MPFTHADQKVPTSAVVRAAERMWRLPPAQRAHRVEASKNRLKRKFVTTEAAMQVAAKA